MIVKICGITNREDAQAAVDGGVTALGFNFYAAEPALHRAGGRGAHHRTAAAGVWKVGVFVNVTPAEVARIRKSAGLDIVQLQGDETPADLPAEGRVWKALHVDEAFNTAQMDAVSGGGVPARHRFEGQLWRHGADIRLDQGHRHWEADRPGRRPGCGATCERPSSE